jgi:TonB family protein
MKTRKSDIEKYLRGELSAAERHALEKEALSDPFLAEALEGIEQAGADTFLYDLHHITKSVRHRARNRSIKNKSIRMWGWTVGIAASVLLIALSGFFVISLLKDQKNRDLALKESSPVVPENKSQDSDSVATTLEPEPKHENIKPPPEQKAVAPDASKATPPVVKHPEPVIEQADVASETHQPPTTGEVLAENEQAARKEDEQAKVKEEERDKIAAAREAKNAPAFRLDDAVREKDVAEKSKKRSSGVKAGAPTPALSEGFTAERKLLKGRVISADEGTALPGVNVMVEGSNIGTVTDAEGNYQLSLPADQSAIVFSFIGYESTEVKVGDQDEVNVKLPADAAQLSEVVVTGFGGETGDEETVPFRFAEPEGGRNAFKNYLEHQVKYPEEALKNKTEGKVTVKFTVEADGKLTDFAIVKGIGDGCEEELIRLIRNGPSWKASTKNNQALRDQVRVRFRFELPK